MAKPNWAPHHAVSKELQGSYIHGSGLWWGLGELCGRRTWIRLSIIRLGFQALRSIGGEKLGLKTSDADSLDAGHYGRPVHSDCQPSGHWQRVRALELSVPSNGFIGRVESQLRAAGLSDGASEGSGEVWCGLCGDRRGWCTCGRCMGEGGFPTRPGLAGVKGTVGWARCKTCFGQKVVPCLFCGISEAPEMKLWLEFAERHPHRSRK